MAHVSLSLPPRCDGSDDDPVSGSVSVCAGKGGAEHGTSEFFALRGVSTG